MAFRREEATDTLSQKQHICFMNLMYRLGNKWRKVFVLDR